MSGPIEQEAGIGDLRSIAGSSILSPAQYTLTIQHSEIAGGLPVIHGRLLNPPSAGFPAHIVGTEVLLRLEDGREWDCRLADAQGSLHPRGEHMR